eukprot:Hpha_TRINITY_DN31424_c0_g1::TRINITY_DN31424_c0_g1_i1::g.145295::m.145295
MGKAPEMEWRCKCGRIAIGLRGKPQLVFNCHCHGCVNPMHFADSLQPPGTSAACEGGGVAKAMYELDQLDLPDGLNASHFRFVKNGEKGGMVRTITKCCNTLMNTAGGSVFPGAFRPFNRNCIYNKDGSLANLTPGEKPINVNAINAFDPAKVPEPKVDEASCGVLCGFLRLICVSKCCCCCNGDAKKGYDRDIFWKSGRSADVEALDVTWE